MTQDVVEAVLQAVAERAADPGAPVTLETPLGPEGAGLDSVAVLELVLELEDHLDVRLRDEDLTAETLATAGSLARHLERLSR